MSVTLQRSAFAPTVLLIDDDSNTTRRWTREFHSSTSLGVVVANSIPDGVRLALNPSIKIDAIVADIFFEPERQSRDLDLSDGVELLSYLCKKDVGAPMFVISASFDMMDYRRKADFLQVPITAYYDKLTAADRRHPAWIEIQRSVLANIFGPGSEVASSLTALPTGSPDAIDLLNETLCRLQLPVRTYIQDLGRQALFGIGPPIEVICVARSPSQVDAYAPVLGLPAHGSGEDIQQAVDSLKELIAIEAETLLGTDPAKLSNYAARVVERLSQFVLLPAEST